MKTKSITDRNTLRARTLTLGDASALADLARELERMESCMTRRQAKRYRNLARQLQKLLAAFSPEDPGLIALARGWPAVAELLANVRFKSLICLLSDVPARDALRARYEADRVIVAASRPAA